MQLDVDTSEYDAIGKMNVLDARAAGMEIINNSKSTAGKKARLNRDIERAPNAAEVVRILWMCTLAAEGLGSLDSNWNKI